MEEQTKVDAAKVLASKKALRDRLLGRGVDGARPVTRPKAGGKRGSKSYRRKRTSKASR